MTAALIIFVITYLGIAFPRQAGIVFPGLILRGVSINRIWVPSFRTAAVTLGAALMLIFRVVSPEHAFALINWHTVLLLMGMTVLVWALVYDGHLNRVADRIFAGTQNQYSSLVRVVIGTVAVSALVINDNAVIVLSPLVVTWCVKRSVSAIPFLIALAMASNIGSVPSAFGNPQNAFVAFTADISVVEFAVHLFFIAVLSVPVLIVVIRMLYHKELSKPIPSISSIEVQEESPSWRHWLSLLVMAGVVLGFVISGFTGINMSMFALVGAGIILLVRPDLSLLLLTNVQQGLRHPRGLVREAGGSWTLPWFFAALFIVIGGITSQDRIFDAFAGITPTASASGVAQIHFLAVGVSQIISNVPFTILMTTTTLSEGTTDLLWLSLVSGATLAGNLTLLGAVANIIVAQQAAVQGVYLGFWEFARTGVVVTFTTVVLSMAVLLFQWRVGLLS